MLPFPKNIRPSLLHQPVYLWLIGIYPIPHLYLANSCNFELQEDRFFTLETSYNEPFAQKEVTQEWLQKTQ